MKKAVFFLTAVAFIAVAFVMEDRNDGNVDTSVLFDTESDEINRYEECFDSMPPGGRKLRTCFRGSYHKAFNDLQHDHLQAAKSIGIEPIVDLSSVLSITQPLEKITTCREYYVDSLTHSMPYLVPQAATLLRDIGRRFNDSLGARGGGFYRIKVTSVLRTPKTIARLRRRNRNAVKTSAHQYGTTFDISYKKFICDSVNIPRTQADMKALLAEVLQDLKEENRCYVKHERRQGCFHITAR